MNSPTDGSHWGKANGKRKGIKDIHPGLQTFTLQLWHFTLLHETFISYMNMIFSNISLAVLHSYITSPFLPLLTITMKFSIILSFPSWVFNSRHFPFHILQPSQILSFLLAYAHFLCYVPLPHLVHVFALLYYLLWKSGTFITFKDYSTLKWINIWGKSYANF